MAGEGIEALYSEAYALVEQGICYDEVGQRDGALAMYERGLQLIDQAGQLPGAKDSPLYRKMADARDHILYRLKDLRTGSEGPTPPSGLPAPPDSPYQAIQGTIQAFGDSKSAEQLFEIQGGCQIFYINGEETSVPSYPGPLKIFRFGADSPSEEAAAADNTPPAFIQVSDWVYPLVPGRSPVLNTSYGAYIFPNPTSQNPDLFVGLLLPGDLEPGERGNFEAMMREMTELRQSSVASQLSQEEEERLANKLARLLVHGGQMLAWGVKKGQEFASGVAAKETEKALQRSERTNDPKAVDPRLLTSVHYLRKGSKVAVRVSGYLVNKVGKIAMKVGARVAESAQKRVGDQSAKGGQLVGDAVEVVKAGVAGVATVWMGMEDAAKVLARDIANDAVRVVDHRYGEKMAALTRDSMKAVGHSGMTAWNVTELGPKAIAKRSAKQAGIAFLSDLGQPGPKSPKGGQNPPPSS